MSKYLFGNNLPQIMLILGELFPDRYFTTSCLHHIAFHLLHLSHRMRKPRICIGKNKVADQIRGYCEADQHLCFRYTDSTIPLLHKSEISSFWLASVTVQAGLCWIWSEPKLLVFSCTGSLCVLFSVTLLPLDKWCDPPTYNIFNFIRYIIFLFLPLHHDPTPTGSLLLRSLCYSLLTQLEVVCYTSTTTLVPRCGVKSRFNWLKLLQNL